jgi:hypothetical protein
VKWIKAAAHNVGFDAVEYFILAWVVLYVVARFPLLQSMVLAVLIAELGREIRRRTRKPARRFSPYYVRVVGKWHELLTDFHLTDKREEWHLIRRSIEEMPFTDYRVLLNGICFTVVNQSEDFERTLVYSNDRRSFASDVDFEEPMITIEREHGILADDPLFRRDDVLLFVKSGWDGYNLGIIVPDWWWGEVKASCPKPMEESKDSSTGRVELILATISYREFDCYWQPAERGSAFYFKTEKQIRDRTDGQRNKFGWMKVERPDIPGIWDVSIEHKYFTVEHRAI